MSVLFFTNRMSTYELVTQHELCEEKSCTLQIALNYFYSLLQFSSIRSTITYPIWLQQSCFLFVCLFITDAIAGFGCECCHKITWTFSKSSSKIFDSQEFHPIWNSLIFAWITQSKKTFYYE